MRDSTARARRRRLMGFLAILAVSMFGGRLTAECPDWIPAFGGEPGVNDAVTAMVEFDDGSGPALYVGGTFTAAGGVAANFIARFDGTTWSAVGDALDGPVFALHVFDDGSGPALFAGGSFDSINGIDSAGIAKWDGSGWSPVGSDLLGAVFAFAEFDDGSGPALYVGGDVGSVIVQGISGIAKWDGGEWTSVGGGVSHFVTALEVFDDGAGDALFAGGFFTAAGGVEANSVAKWDGTSWSALGSGVRRADTIAFVSALTVFDDGSGPALHVGGDFTIAGDASAYWVAKWGGDSWSQLGEGPVGIVGKYVVALEVFDDGNGPALFIGGDFWSTGGDDTENIVKWDGQNWSGLGDGINGEVHAFAVFDGGDGPALFAGGDFSRAGGTPAKSIAAWDGEAWSGTTSGLDGNVYAIAEFDDGSGPTIYVAGDFTSANGVVLNHIAKWENGAWAPLGSGLSGPALALVVFDDGAGPALYVGGSFRTAGGKVVNRIARWDGHEWSALAEGIGGESGSTVGALSVFDDGEGAALYAGGAFNRAGGDDVRNIAKWDGVAWTALGSGVSGSVGAIVGFDDGNGADLYAGGFFRQAGGVTVNSVARWDGESWTSVGGGLRGANNFAIGFAFALCVFDDGAGPAMYIGGRFRSIGDVTTNHIAKWDGATWSAVGGGVLGGEPLQSEMVRALTTFDDGAGEALYVGGHFNMTGATPANFIAKWNGTMWSSLQGGLSGTVQSLVATDDGLIVGGSFETSPSSDSFIARWGCERSCEADYNNDGFVTGADIAAFARDLHRDPGRTDLNGDGRSDGRDVRVFVSIWAAGCGE